jgi:hypothetical protein
MEAQMAPLVGMCVTGLQDPHAKVRWAACQALGQMCTDLGPSIQEAHGGAILPALMAAMDDFANPRVQAHASAAGEREREFVGSLFAWWCCVLLRERERVPILLLLLLHTT